MTEPASLTVSHSYAASAERVFDAWLDPDKAGRFLFATPGGEMTRVEIDPVVGGAFVIVERRDGVEVEHVGRYLEVDRPRRLVFEFAVPAYSQDRGRVEIEIVPRPDGGCVLTLTAWVPPDYLDRTRQGWVMILATLERVVG